MIIAWILGFLALAAGALLVERRLVYRPTRFVLQTPAHVDLHHEELALETEDGVRLSAWWIPRPDAVGTVLYFHGNKGTMSDRVWMARDLARLPVNVMMVDYRGFGNSAGKPSVRGTRRDALAAWEQVRARHGGGAEPPVVVFGASLGGAVAAQLAAERSVRGLVLECTFTTTVEVGKILYPFMLPTLTCVNRYDTLGVVRRYEGPLLISHSREDAVIPFRMGGELFEASPSADKRFVELRGKHCEFPWRESPGYWEAFADFVRGCLRG